MSTPDTFILTGTPILVQPEHIMALLGIKDQAEKDTIEKLILQGEAALQGYIENRLLPTTRTEEFGRRIGAHRTRLWPIAREGLTINQIRFDGSPSMPIPTDHYRVDALTGRIWGDWLWGDYSLTYQGGLALHPDWESIIAPELSASIQDWVADRYENTDPAIRTEADGNGLLRQTNQDEIPERILQIWRAYRRLI